MKHRVNGPDGFRVATSPDLARLYRWYREAQILPFFTEIAGPTPSFSPTGFRDYCRTGARLSVGRDCSSFLLLTYIQTTMRVANVDFNHRDTPAPDTPNAIQLSLGLGALCAQAQVLKVQLLSLASDQRRIALAESLGMRREGLLRDHFYHAGAYHDLIYFGYRVEGGP